MIALSVGHKPLQTAKYPNICASSCHRRQDAIPYVLKEFFGVKDGLYPRTPFNTIRLGLLQGRSMVLGGRAAVAGKPGAIPTPVKPWMGFQN